MALIGDLGSGKTTFTKGLALALKVQDNVTSPTFVLMKEYDSPALDGKFIHIDCYRMESEEDAISIGIDEKINNNLGVMVIEWADKIEKILPNRTKKVFFKSAGSGKIIKLENNATNN